MCYFNNMQLFNYGKVNLDNFNEHKALFNLAMVISGLAIALSTCALLVDDWLPKLCIVLFITIAITLSVYTTFIKTLPRVARSGLFIFLASASTPSIDTALFYWLTDYDNGPKFSPIFIGCIGAVAFAAMFIGVLIYNYYLSSWSYRSIFTLSLISLICLSIFDVILVMRWNLDVGIPDALLVFGDSAMSPVASRFYIMPMLILAAKVCPQGAEATLFAMMMSLNNLGGAVSSYLGALLLLFFDVNSDNYSNLVWVILIKTACKLFPLALIPILIPVGSPSDVEPEDTSNHSEGSTSNKVLLDGKLKAMELGTLVVNKKNGVSNSADGFNSNSNDGNTAASSSVSISNSGYGAT